MQVWDTKRGSNKPYLSEVIKKDTTVNLKDLQEVRWKHNQSNGKRYQEANRNYFKPR